MTEQLYCDVAECDDPQDPGHPRPAFRDGKCSTHMKQLQRTGRTTKIAEKLNAEERAIELGSKMLGADDDPDYEQHRRAWVLACRELGDQERVSALRKSLAAAKANGRRLGRPPKVEAREIIRLVRLLGRTSLVAQVKGISTRTVQRHLLNATKTRILSRRSARPRRAG